MGYPSRLNQKREYGSKIKTENIKNDKQNEKELGLYVMIKTGIL